MFEIDIVEKMKNTSYVQYLFSSKIFAVYEIISKNIIEQDRTQMTIWCMSIVCWIPNVTNAHSEYVYLLLLHGNNGYTNAS